jgi:A/G-specific adenine glycosylase
MKQALNDSTIARIAGPLLRWYRVHHRRLPWRAAPGHRGDPYHVLLSEFMLQQTQVATVIGYFNRFIAALPTIGDLASAPEQRVLRLWQGLGYYRRARHLHQAARRIVEQHGGRTPSEPAALRALPGVGRYTAGAIASIAHGKAAPIVDGNVARVLARLLAIGAAIDSPAAQKRLWALAERIVLGRTDAGDVNQAMMELGATVCTPRQPRCEACPLRAMCRAAGAGAPGRYPRKGRGAKVRGVRHWIIGVERRGKRVWQRRGEGGLWAGMWQQPTIEQGDGPGAGAGSWPELGLKLDEVVEVGRFVHQTTHRRIEFVVCRARCMGGRLRRGAGEWREDGAEEDLPLSNPQRRALRMLRERGDH